MKDEKYPAESGFFCACPTHEWFFPRLTSYKPRYYTCTMENTTKSNANRLKFIVVVAFLLIVAFLYPLGGFPVLIPFIASLVLIFLLTSLLNGICFQGTRYYFSLLLACNIMFFWVFLFAMVSAFGVHLDPGSSLVFAILISPFMLTLPIISVINILYVIAYVRKHALTRKVYILSILVITVSGIVFTFTIQNFLAFFTLIF